MKINLISKSETSTILKQVSLKWKQDVPKIKNLKAYYITDDSQILVADNFKMLRLGEDYIPFLSELELLENFPKVIVDMGAVKFMCKGANLMRPGIKKFTEFEKDKLVCIVEETHHKFLAVGKSTVSSSELENMEKGEVIQNLHYISDKFWETGKTIYD